MAPTSNPTPQIPLVFDTDPGVDDALALLMLARHPAVQLLGVTTVFGNADIETTTRNALALCQLFGAVVPVARGAGTALAGSAKVGYPVHVHGRNGLGEVELPLSAGQGVDARPAHAFICDTVNQRPGEVTLLAVGPLTNLALALQADPALAGKVRRVVVMGGAFGGHGHTGNVSPVAEANIAADPAAADRVFTAAWPVTVVGLDVTQQVVMGRERLEALRRPGDAVGQALWQATRVYHDWYQRRAGIDGIYLHDPSAAACVIDPALFQCRRGAVRVVTQGVSAGQTLQVSDPAQYPPNAWTDAPMQDVCTEVDAAGVLALLDRLMPGAG